MTKKKELSVKVGDRKDGLEGESRASEQASQRPRVKDVRRIKGNPLILLLEVFFLLQLSTLIPILALI